MCLIMSVLSVPRRLSAANPRKNTAHGATGCGKTPRLQLILGGAALQRCDKPSLFSPTALAAEVAHTVFQDTLPPSRTWSPRIAPSTCSS